MQPEQRDRAYLWDMLQAARAVLSFIEDRTFAEYEKDLLLRSGVERQIEIIGEAANKVSAALQSSTSDIPWRGIIAQRHVLALNMATSSMSESGSSPTNTSQN